jgi:hypothetical protein
MSSDKLAARKGRLRQRYDNEHRLVAGSVPLSLSLSLLRIASLLSIVPSLVVAVQVRPVQGEEGRRGQPLQQR